MLLCEVSLGKSMLMTCGNYKADQIARAGGYHSVHGVGMRQPKNDEAIERGGIKIPMGQLVSNPTVERSDLLYNEYIVYDVAQVRLRYLVQCCINFHRSECY